MFKSDNKEIRMYNGVLTVIYTNSDPEQLVNFPVEAKKDKKETAKLVVVHVIKCYYYYTE